MQREREPAADGGEPETSELEHLVRDDPSIESDLDKLVADSFPASDPPGFTGDGNHEREIRRKRAGSGSARAQDRPRDAEEGR